MLKLVFEKAGEPEIKLPTSSGSSKKQENSRKTSIFSLLTMPKPWTCVDHKKLWKILQEMGIPDHRPCLLRQVKKQQLELNMEEQTGSKQEKEYIKAVYCHPAYLTYMQGTSWETLDSGRSTSWNQDCREKYQNLRYTDDTTLMAESKEELKSLLMKVKVESEKAGLKFNIHKTKIMASSPITS